MDNITNILTKENKNKQTNLLNILYKNNTRLKFDKLYNVKKTIIKINNS